jgi:hypothetical protein
MVQKRDLSSGRKGKASLKAMPVRSADPLRRSLDLPPPYDLVTLRESGDAHERACALAPERGAGTLVVVGRYDLVEFAVVLEPEEPLAGARRAFYAGMAALADAIAAHCPPEKELAIRFPDTLLFDSARVGGARLAWPEACAEDAVPDWLVFSAMITAARVGLGEAGFAPGSTSLEEEGFEGGGQALVESFSRHLMVHLDAWAEQGFRPVGQAYLDRLPKERAADQRLIDANGDVLVRPGGGGGQTQRLALAPALAAPAWIDPSTGAPKL